MASTAQKFKQNLATLEASYATKLATKNWKSYSHTNRMKTKKNIRSIKKQIGLYESIPFERNILGSSSVNESSFKYTTDADRKRSVIAMYPFFPDLVRIPFMIDWASYRYTGSSTLLFGEYDDDSNETSNLFETATVDVSYSETPLKKDCFYFFGGCAYEILNHAIKVERLLVDPSTTTVPAGGAGNTNNYAKILGVGRAGEVDMNFVTEYEIPFLHDLVDPTGDVDVRIRRPYVKITHSDSDGEVYENDFTDETLTTLNEWVLHWVNWLFKNVATIFKASIVRKGVFSLTEPFDLMENSEIEGGTVLRSELIDNTYVVLLQKGTMVKVQIVMKLKGVSASDHYFEMVIALAQNLFSAQAGSTLVNRMQQVEQYPDFLNKLDYMSRAFDLRSMNLPNVRLESFYSLVDGNRSGIKDRFVLATSRTRHKFYNHVQRLKYLNQIFPYFVVGSEELSLPRNNSRRYLLSKKREMELAKKPYLTDITNTSILASFQKLFQLLKTFDKAKGLLGANAEFMGVNPVCLFNYNWAGAPCTLEQVEMDLFGNMIPIFSKMLQSTEKGIFKNLNRFTKRNVPKKPAEEKPVYEPVALMHGTVRNRRTRRIRRS